MRRELSDVLKTIKPSITMGVTAIANELKRSGKTVYSFGAGEPDFKVAEPVKQASIEAVKKDLSKYTDVEGLPELREAAAESLNAANGTNYTPKEIIVSSGAKHSLFTAICAICSHGDEVIIPTPSWVSYEEMTKVAGAVPVMVPTRRENRFILQPDELRSAITDRTKILLLNNPSNPVGSVYTEDELRAAAEVCLEYGIYIISDEIYDKFIYDGIKFHSTAALSEEIKDITLTVNGFSKTYAMPGWRVGYTAAPEYIIKAMSTIQGHCVSHPSTVSQYAAAKALKADQSFVDEMLEEYARRRMYFRDFLLSKPSLSFISPQGAFYYFVDISEHIGLSYNGTKITDDLSYTKLLLENKYVVCVPGSFFGAKNFIRFSYAADMHDIECGLSLYSDFIDELRQ